MKQIDNFVKHTFKNIPSEDKKQVIEKVSEILHEKVDDLMEKGYDEKSAIDKTVVEFGTVEDYYDPIQHEVLNPKNRKTVKHYRNDFLFSLLGALIIIGLLVFTNLYYTPSIIWFVIPMLAVLWWPLAVMYNYLNKKIK